jgi:hypothetical protein
LDVVWLLISVPAQYGRQWRWPKFATVVLFFVVALQQEYVGFFTSLVLAPLPPRTIATNKELFEAGFKILIDPASYGNGMDQNFNRTGVPFSDSLFLPGANCSGLESPALCAAKYVGIGTMLDIAKLVDYHVQQMEIERPDLHCAAVDEAFDDSAWETAQFVGHLQGPIQRFVSNLLAGGIDKLWDSLYIDGTWRKVAPESKQMFTYARLSFNTGLSSVFNCYGILIGVCALVFVLELLYAWVHRTRVRHKLGNCKSDRWATRTVAVAPHFP